ncbi:unnamed protein product [Ixodes pacificus]
MSLPHLNLEGTDTTMTQHKHLPHPFGFPFPLLSYPLICVKILSRSCIFVTRIKCRCYLKECGRPCKFSMFLFLCF